MYIVTTQVNEINLFLVDRRITKSHWWTVKLSEAIHFRKFAAAKRQQAKLKYNCPEVVDLEEAERLECENDNEIAWREMRDIDFD